jgi:hypothetical protein
MGESQSVKDSHFIGLLSEEGMRILRERALSGDLFDTSIRGICWRVCGFNFVVYPTNLQPQHAYLAVKVFMGVLSHDPTTWKKDIAKHRAIFESIRDKHIFDPHSHAANAELEKNNPLSQHEEVMYNR